MEFQQEHQTDATAALCLGFGVALVLGSDCSIGRRLPIANVDARGLAGPEVVPGTNQEETDGNDPRQGGYRQKEQRAAKVGIVVGRRPWSLFSSSRTQIRPARSIRWDGQATNLSSSSPCDSFFYGVEYGNPFATRFHADRVTGR